MFVSLSDHLELKSVPASEAWELYSTLSYAKIIVELMPELFDKVEVLDSTSNGKAGTVLLISFKAAENFPASAIMKEKYTVVDDERRVKVAEILEGWFFEHGLISMRTKFEITEKLGKNGEGEEEESCILKYGVELEAKDLTAAMGAMPSFKHLTDISEAIAKHLITNRKKST